MSDREKHPFANPGNRPYESLVIGNINGNDGNRLKATRLDVPKDVGRIVSASKFLGNYLLKGKYTTDLRFEETDGRRINQTYIGESMNLKRELEEMNGLIFDSGNLLVILEEASTLIDNTGRVFVRASSLFDRPLFDSLRKSLGRRAKEYFTNTRYFDDFRRLVPDGI